MFSIGWQQKQFYVDLILLNFSKDSQRNDKSFGWHLLGPEFDAQWERISEAWIKKNPLVVPRPLSGYVSCSSPSGWVVAE
jgi:hypothetical protein